MLRTAFGTKHLLSEFSNYFSHFQSPGDFFKLVLPLTYYTVLNSECEQASPLLSFIWFPFHLQPLKIRFPKLLLKQWPLFLLSLTSFWMSLTTVLAVIHIRWNHASLILQNLQHPQSTTKTSPDKMGGKADKGYLSPGFTVWLQTGFMLVYEEFLLQENQAICWARSVR